METPSPIDVAEPTFLDNFLQDRNIKWILGIGTAILLGSSLMLVTSQWTGYAPALKETIILAYTGLIFAAGRYGYEKMALRRTGTVLLALSVLLAPVACAALPWVYESGSWFNIVYLVLLVVSGGLTARIGSKTFKHFLRESQPTLTAAYVALALAGAIVPLGRSPEFSLLLSPVVALGLWGVFAAGVIKSNRRVFWLIEEQQRPRIFGFFPMLLLGTQFVSLFAVYFAGQTNLDWIGFGCVLTAVPILLAADAVAHVFQQRTGNLFRPLPWSILSPLAAGLVLAVVGVVLSGVHVFDGVPYALVPTSALAAVLAACVARRTERREFVYAALLLTTVAYRFLPVFFLATVNALIHSTAHAIHESRLPLAFYGFTFVPLLTAFTAASVWCRRRGDELFAEPTKAFAVALSVLFLVLAPTHAKALFPAAITLSAVFALQARAFRHRGLILPAILAWFMAAAGLPMFAHGVLETSFGGLLQANDWFLCEIGASLLLLVPGYAIDRRLMRRPAVEPQYDLAGNRLPFVPSLFDAPCRLASQSMTGLLTAFWSVAYLGDLPHRPGYAAAGVLAALAVVHALVSARSMVGIGSLLFVNFVAGAAIAEYHTDVTAFAPMAAAFLFVQWVVSYWLAARPEWRVSQAFAIAAHRCSLGLLVLLGALNFVPCQLWQIVFAEHVVEVPYIVASVAMLAWLCDAARRELDLNLGILAVLDVFVLAAAALRTYAPAAWPWLPTLMVLVAAILLPVVVLLRRYGLMWMPVVLPAQRIVPIVLSAAAIGSLGFFSFPQLVTGLAAVAVLALWMADLQHPLRIQLPLVLLNWRLLGVVVAMIHPQADHLLELIVRPSMTLCIPIALACSLSALLWTLFDRRDEESQLFEESELTRLHRSMLRVLGCYMLLLSTQLHWQLPRLDVASIVMAGATFLFYFVGEIIVGCRRNDERRIWVAEVVAGAAIAYFAFFGVIRFGHGYSMYLVLIAGFILSLVGYLAQRRPAIGVLARPFTITGKILPMVTVLIGVGRHIHYIEIQKQAQWLGWNSLALLAAAAFYFRQGLVDGRRRWTVLAAGILNVAVVLLWREMKLTDPQFYMIPIGITILALVELLEREIPEAYRDPFRYAGALVILVSPTFHIVQGSWLHLFTLMVASVLVILAAIGLRVRALVYTGTAFLAADLAAMVIRGSIDHPQLLWIAGLSFGAALLGLGALCELKREQVLQRVRTVSAALEAFR